jgi:hypothetical protein
VNATRTEHRLNDARTSRADPAQALAAAVVIVALADAGDTERPWRRADAVGWLTQGAGVKWCSLLGADELLADALAALD